MVVIYVLWDTFEFVGTAGLRYLAAKSPHKNALKKCSLWEVLDASLHGFYIEINWPTTNYGVFCMNILEFGTPGSISHSYPSHFLHLLTGAMFDNRQWGRDRCMSGRTGRKLSRFAHDRANDVMGA